eukprot:490526_1
MNTQSPKAVVNQYAVSIDMYDQNTDSEEPPKQPIQIENDHKSAITTNTPCINEFLEEMHKPGDCPCCYLWIQTNIWLILQIIAYAYNIYLFKVIFDILQLDCSYQFTYTNDEYIMCSIQKDLITAGFTSKVVSIYYIFYGIGIFVNLIAFCGVYRCIPLLILLHILFVLAFIIDNFCWAFVLTNVPQMIGNILDIWPLLILIRVYKITRQIRKRNPN